MKIKTLFMVIILLSNTNIFALEEIEKSIVRIFVASYDITNQNESYQYNKIRYNSGTALVVDKNKILTSSSLVSNATWIKVYKYNSSIPYLAKVKRYSNYSNLALLDILDKSFFQGLKPIKFSKNIKEKNKISIISYRFLDPKPLFTHSIVDSIKEVNRKNIKKDFPILQINEDLGEVINGSVIINMKQEIVAMGIGLDTYFTNQSYAISSKTIEKFLNDKNLFNIEKENIFEEKAKIIILGIK